MKPAAIVVIATLAAATTVFAHGGATGIVKERMDQMSAIAKAMKAIGGMLKGSAPYDAARIRTLAGEIATLDDSRLSHLFPRDSLMKPTEARAEIWTDWPRFSDQARDMRQAALALANGSDQATAGPLFRTLTQTCKTCHADFRIKKQ